jgi:hypothetical protein
MLLLFAICIELSDERQKQRAPYSVRRERRLL